MPKRNPFDPITWTRRHSLDATSKMVLLAVIAHIDNHTLDCFVGQKQLAEETGLSTRTIERHMPYIEAMGFIRRERRHRSNGSHSSDHITVLMESVDIDIPIPCTHSEWEHERKRAVQTDVQTIGLTDTVSDPNRQRVGPITTLLTTTPTAEAVGVEEEIGVGNGVEERVREEALLSPRKDERTFMSTKRIIEIVVAQEVDGEWEIEVEGLRDFENNRQFVIELGDILETGFKAGLDAQVLEDVLNNHWQEKVPWNLLFDVYQRKVAELCRERIRAVP